MMKRENWERMEVNSLSEYAQCALNSRGREREEEECQIRTCYQRDVDRIIHSKAFRRLKHKTQVFLSPEGDHYRTRLTHTLEVSQIARTIVRALGLNQDLTEAICMGHDLGHTPFGHAGEKELHALTDGRFTHNLQSVRVVERIEKNGEGLNLTWEVRDGIEHHSGNVPAATYEGRVVHLADRIAYINHDIDDAVRAGILKTDDIPESLRAGLGQTHAKRINAMVTDAIEESDRCGDICMSAKVSGDMNELRNFMFKNVYRIPVALAEERKVRGMINRLFKYYSERPEELPNEYREIAYNEGIENAVCDYIAGMTDRYALKVYQNIFLPRSWGGAE